MGKLLAFTVLSCLCGAMAQFGYVPPPIYQRTALGDSIDVATMKILKEKYVSSDDKNIVSSPLSLMTLLSLFNVGAGPVTKTEITRFLGGTDFALTSEYYRELNARFSIMDPDYLTMANKVCVSNLYTLNATFAATARAYHSEFDTVDFSNPDEAAAEMNRWASKKTNGHITEPVKKGTLDPDTAAVLLNVIYFSGHWHVPFKAEETKEKDFHVSRSEVVKKPMMHLLQSLFYTESEELGAKLVELPYKEYGFRMVVVLPNEVDGLPSVIEKVAEKGLLSDVFKLAPAGSDVDLDMPKFDIRTKLDFNQILPKIGVGKMFEEGATAVINERPVIVDKAFQEAFIKVDEEGATAGAFTGVVMVPYAEPPERPIPKKFTADHPFLFTIFYEDKILFAGTYSA